MSADLARLALDGDLLPAAEQWQTGDVVLAADRSLWCRANTHDIAEGWPWAYLGDRVPKEAHEVAEGAVAEGHPKRPLTLLVRGGVPVVASGGEA